MANCKRCSKSVVSAVVVCECCKADRAQDLLARFCGEMCRWPIEAKDQEALAQHCARCWVAGELAGAFDLGRVDIAYLTAAQKEESC